MKRIFVYATLSLFRFIQLIFSRKIYLYKQNINKVYMLPGRGKYKIFRETRAETKFHDTEVTFMVGFRLRWLGANPFLHWLFQRICILTTPFWSGLKGFHIKLWMVNPSNKNYVGIYEWYQEKDAQTYIDILLPVLRFFSTENSVWYVFYPEKDLAVLESSLKQQ